MALKIGQGRARRGRPPKNEVMTRWNMTLPSKVAAPWELVFLDARSGQTKVGVRQFIVSELLRLTMNAWQEGKTTIDVSGIVKKITQELRETPVDEG